MKNLDTEIHRGKKEHTELYPLKFLTFNFEGDAAFTMIILLRAIYKLSPLKVLRLCNNL